MEREIEIWRREEVIREEERAVHERDVLRRWDMRREMNVSRY